MSSLWNQFELVHHPSSWVVLMHFSSSINESGHRRIAAAAWVTAWWCGAIKSAAAAIVPMGCQVDWTSKGQQNNKPMMNRRKLVPKWKSQYTSQLFTFPSNLVGNFILVFKFLTNDTTKFKVTFLWTPCWVVVPNATYPFLNWEECKCKIWHAPVYRWRWMNTPKIHWSKSKKIVQVKIYKPVWLHQLYPRVQDSLQDNAE